MKIIRLKTGRHGILRTGHPWIYKRQLLKVDPSIRPGDIVSLINSENKFVGKGYYNPKSEISIRIVSFGDETLNKQFFYNRVKGAIEKRKGLLVKTNAYRAVFSEADGLPGLIVDVYSDTAVFQILTLGMEKVKDSLIESIKTVLNPRYLYEKSKSPFRKLEGLKDIAMWHGKTGDAVIEIFEGKAFFLADIVNGHKTGFYLDQRNSRLAMEGISKGKKILDIFCYTGAFSVHAAISGAQKILGADIKDDWIKLGRKNTELNKVAAKIEFIKGDAFSVLKNIHNSGELFDIIIIDPPSFLKSKESLASASKGYKELNLIAMKTLTEGGILATFSCSYNMPNEIFSKILKEAAIAAKKKIMILKRCHQADDHPIVRTIPETEYLKGYFLKIDPI